MQNRKVEDEIKFKNLVKNPTRLFGLTYLYFFVMILIIGVFYVKNLDKISFNTVPESFIDSLNVSHEIAQKAGGILPAVNLKEVLNPDQNLIQKGKELFDANCQSCHGQEGNGDGPAGVALNPKPRNFHAEDGWTNGRTFFDMYKTLQEGIIGNGMAAYEYLRPADRIAIIQYMRTFADFPKYEVAELSTRLDASYNLSAGVVVPNQIPISKSIVLISNELKNKVENAGFELNNSKGAEILYRVSNDPEKFVRVFKTNYISENLENFISAVMSDPDAFGLSENVLSLSTSDWQTLFDFSQKLGAKN